MKNKDLIEKLSQLPEDTEVCIFDWRKNLSDDCGEGSSVGIYPKIEVALQGKDEIREGSKPWIAIGFQNIDYNDDGEFVE